MRKGKPMANQNRDDARHQFHLTYSKRGQDSSQIIVRQLMKRGKAVRTGPCARNVRLFSQADWGASKSKKISNSNSKSSFSFCSVFRKPPLYGYIETAS